ncbi:MAG: T9SS type A sorting domain-containing protein [Ignavibacteriales bacterium]|nr:T9SS type A sorting domain-containing protein [Ignavibacteriales bacterium]
MKRIKIFPLILLILLSSNSILFAQEPDTLWTKRIGGDSIDVAYDVEELWDGGFAVVGYTKSIPLTDYDIWLLRTDSNGDTLWTKTYGGDGDEYAYSMKKTEDGGFIIAGTTNSFGVGQFDFYVIRTDSLGDTLWTRTFGGANDDICWSVDKTFDGGFIFAGEKDAFPEVSDAMLIKTDPLGEPVWEKHYGTLLDDKLYSIKATESGDFVASGTVYFGIQDVAGWLLKIDADGDSLWSKFYGDIKQDLMFGIALTSDGGYVLSGGFRVPSTFDYDLWLIKTDSSGSEQWSQTLDYENDTDIGYSVQQTSDGGYIITGQAAPFDGGLEAWLVRTDSIGNILWDKLLPFFPRNLLNNLDNPNAGSNGAHGGNSIKQISDGGYIMAGYSDKIQGNHLDVYLVRIASDIIPVELTSFTATTQQNAVALNWQTATETNNSGFEIERKQVGSPQSSVSNQDWNQIAFIPGFGTTTEPKSYSFVDENLSSGKYQYRLKQIDFDGSFEYSNTVEVEINSPTEFSLGQNYPNPFNPTTKIKYTIPTVTLSLSKGDIYVTLKVYDILGNEVATLVNEPQQPGTYEVEFNVGQAISLSSGVYYYQLRSGGFVETKKMILFH